MKVKEILREDSGIASEIRYELVDKGYEFLGSGVDQEAYLAPDGTVLKIFGTQGRSLSRQQRSFITFAEYCQANSDNPFLPNIIDFAKFLYDEKLYLQIKIERLFEFEDAGYLARQLSEIADVIEDNKIVDPVKWLNDEIEDFEEQLEYFKNNGKPGQFSASVAARERSLNNLNQFVLYLGGEDAFRLLFSTITDLKKIAARKGYILDLHDGNFMLGSDGHIVINDPFYVEY